MDKLIFLFVPLTTMIAACLAMLYALLFLKRRALSVAKEEFARLGTSAGSTPAADHEIAALLDERLDRTVEAFKVKIPLAGMFLSKEKEASLKELAHNELMKMVPALKKRLLSGESSGLAAAFARPIIDKVWRRLAFPLFGICALVGLAFGLLQALFLFYM